MRTDPIFQKGDQFGLHEGVVVGDVEADDALATQPVAEAAVQLRAMRPFHHEDDVGPVDVVGVHDLLRIRRQPRRRRLQARPTGEHPLGRRRAQAVTGAEEEEVGQEALNAMLDPL